MSPAHPAAMHALTPTLPPLPPQEVKFEPTVMVNRLNPKQALSDMDCDSGDIFIVQRVVGPEEEAQLRHPHADVYLRYIQHRRMVHFKRLEDPKEEGFTLELHKEMDYDQVCVGGEGAVCASLLHV
jgi:ubiquitin carboxyl-terminal hydrolase 7